MKCPVDKTEMEQARLVSQPGGLADIKISKLKKSKSSWLGEKLNLEELTAWYCPKCGKVELYTEPEKKEEK